MNLRSKKYYESRKSEKGDKKGSASIAGYDEQNETTVKKPKENPAPPKTKNQLKEDSPATRDDTGGGNDSGKRSDEN